MPFDFGAVGVSSAEFPNSHLLGVLPSDYFAAALPKETITPTKRQQRDGRCSFRSRPQPKYAWWISSWEKQGELAS